MVELPVLGPGNIRDEAVVDITEGFVVAVDEEVVVIPHVLFVRIGVFCEVWPAVTVCQH